MGKGRPVTGRRRTSGGVPVGDDGRGGAELGLGLASAGPAQFGGRKLLFFNKLFFQRTKIIKTKKNIGI